MLGGPEDTLCIIKSIQVTDLMAKVYLLEDEWDE
jgi:hypothetical protein